MASPAVPAQRPAAPQIQAESPQEAMIGYLRQRVSDLARQRDEIQGLVVRAGGTLAQLP